VNVLSASLRAGGLCACRYAGRNQTARFIAAGRPAQADCTRAGSPRRSDACQAGCARETSRSHAYSLGVAHDRKV
jgi:hypothetical protein